MKEENYCNNDDKEIEEKEICANSHFHERNLNREIYFTSKNTINNT